jgi:TPR repeat protein
MTASRKPVAEPFDLALPEFYARSPQPRLYRRLVEVGARIGDPLAQYAMATWYLLGNKQVGIRKNTSKAVALLESCAHVFNRAAYDLAVCKLRGIGTKKDPEIAFALFTRAANLGSLAGLEERANCLSAGTGTEVNLEAARFYSQQVACWKRQLQDIRSQAAPAPTGKSRWTKGRRTASTSPRLRRQLKKRK